MVVRRPSSLFTKSTSSSSQHSVASSRSTSSHRTRSWDIDDKDDMSSEDHASSRPLTVTIPQATGPYCQRRPNLKEILTNTSPPPWTLAAFMAYLSANLCLENLEFTMDAGRYQKHYAKMMAKAGPDGNPPKKDSEYVRLLWVRLIDAYIAPNGSREVNLPSSVRDPILNAPTTPMPPAPATLDTAVSKTYELMEESVLQPFLNSLCPQTSVQPSSSWQERSHFREPLSAHTQTEHDSMIHRQRKSRNPSPPLAPPPLHHTSSEPSQGSSTSTAVNRLSTSIGLNKSRFAGGKSSSSGSGLSTTLSNTSDLSLTKANWSGQAMTDDSGSTSSPTNEAPVTPPVSPPISELSSHSAQGQQSSKHNRDSGMWKRLGRLSGFKGPTKKKGSTSDEHH